MTRFLLNLVRMFDLTISRPSSNMGHVGLKTMSPGQILRNSCLHYRGQIFDLILMKLDQNVCLTNIYVKFEYEGSKTRSPGKILGNSCLHCRGHICDPILMKLG